MKLQAISDRNLLMNQLKRSLPMLLLFTIILVLTVPLCAMLSLGQDRSIQFITTIIRII